MSVRDWQILKDVEEALGSVAGLGTVLTTVCESNVEVPASGFPAGLVLWKETQEKLSGAERGELSGRVKFVVSIVVRDPEEARGLETALGLAEAARDAVLADVTRSGLASATNEGAATERGKAEVGKERQAPLVEVRVSGSCGYYVERGGE